MEQFCIILTIKFAWTTEPGGIDWNDWLPSPCLPTVPASLQESTQESPFYLLYGSLRKEWCVIDMGDYIEEFITHGYCMVEHKAKWSRHSKNSSMTSILTLLHCTFSSSDRVFVSMLAKTTGKTRKFARTFHRTYCALEVFEQGVSALPFLLIIFKSTLSGFLWIVLGEAQSKCQMLFSTNPQTSFLSEWWWQVRTKSGYRVSSNHCTWTRTEWGLKRKAEAPVHRMRTLWWKGGKK